MEDTRPDAGDTDTITLMSNQRSAAYTIVLGYTPVSSTLPAGTTSPTAAVTRVSFTVAGGNANVLVPVDVVIVGTLGIATCSTSFTPASG